MIEDDFAIYEEAHSKWRDFYEIRFSEYSATIKIYFIYNKLANTYHRNVDGTLWYVEDQYTAGQVVQWMYVQMQLSIEESLLGNNDV